MIVFLSLLGLVAGRDFTGLRYETRDSFVFITVPRVGSGPGDKNIEFRVDMESNEITMTGVPSRYSQTAREVNDTNNIYEDTFYWPQTYSVQHFEGKSEENVMGFGPSSDLWQQFKWMELCPRHGQIFLHKKGYFDDIHLHECGKGKSSVFSSNCDSVPQCRLFDGATQLEHFGLAQRSDVNVNKSSLIPGFELTVGVEIRDNTSLPNRVNAMDLGVYSSMDPNGKTIEVYEEYEAKHTHTAIGFLVIESLLIFYLHFVSDQKKDVDNCKWTRMPTYIGNCVAVISMSLIYYHFDVYARLFHSSPLFRNHKGNHIMADYLFYLVFTLSIVVHLLLTTTKKNLPFRRLHLEVLYDLVLQFPLTIALMGGGRFNLMNLLFAFVITLVVIGSRTRDIISVARSFYMKKHRHSMVDAVLYFVEITAITSYFVLVWNTVWVPAFQNLFVMATLPYRASACALVIFCAAVARIVIDHKMYTSIDDTKEAQE